MSKDKASRKLALKRETITTLTGDDLDNVHGGSTPLAVSATVSLASIISGAVSGPLINIFGTGDAKSKPPKGLSVPATRYTAPGTAPPGTGRPIPGRCCSPETPILTPDGEIAIRDVGVGDRVYSLQRGKLVVVPVIRTCRVRVHQHRVARVALDNGRVLFVTPTHPTADGRLVGDLRPGNALGAFRVSSLEIVDYKEYATHDILPHSETGTYIAAGALLGSTLFPVASRARDEQPTIQTPHVGS